MGGCPLTSKRYKYMHLVRNYYEDVMIILCWGIKICHATWVVNTFHVHVVEKLDN